MPGILLLSVFCHFQGWIPVPGLQKVKKDFDTTFIKYIDKCTGLVYT